MQAGDMSDPFADAERKALLKRKMSQARTTVIPPSTGVPAAQQAASALAAAGPAATPAGTLMLAG